MTSAFQISDVEYEEIKARFLYSLNPLRIRQFPAQEKKKYALILLVHQLFVDNKTYSESEINDVIEPVYKDYATLRRMLVDYHLLSRTPDGRIYKKNPH